MKKGKKLAPGREEEKKAYEKTKNKGKG